MIIKACPYCGATKTAKIVYGMPAMSPKLMDLMDKGEIVLGGCSIIDGTPEYRCNECNKEFSSREGSTVV